MLYHYFPTLIICFFYPFDLTCKLFVPKIIFLLIFFFLIFYFFTVSGQQKMKNYSSLNAMIVINTTRVMSTETESEKNLFCIVFY